MPNKHETLKFTDMEKAENVPCLQMRFLSLQTELILLLRVETSRQWFGDDSPVTHKDPLTALKWKYR